MQSTHQFLIAKNVFELILVKAAKCITDLDFGITWYYIDKYGDNLPWCVFTSSDDVIVQYLYPFSSILWPIRRLQHMVYIDSNQQ